MAKRKTKAEPIKLVHAGELVDGKLLPVCQKTHAGDGTLNIQNPVDTGHLMMVDECGGLCPRCAMILNAYSRGWNAAVRSAALAEEAPAPLPEQNAPTSGMVN